MSAPMVGAYLLIAGGMLAEYAIVGRALGPKAIAALGLAATLSLVLLLTFHAVEIAVQAIVSRRVGEGNDAAAASCMKHGVVVSFVLGGILALLFALLGRHVFAGANDVESTALALEYFRARLPGLPFMIAALSLIGFFNGIGKPTVVAAVYGTALVVNVGGGWLLVNGGFGIPALGIAGAGWAQSLSAVAAMVIFGVALLLPATRRRFGNPFAWQAPETDLLRRLGVLAGPVFVQQLLGNLGMYFFSLVNARVPDGGISLATVSICRQLGYLTYLPATAFGLAAATLVGRSLGSRHLRRAYVLGWMSWILAATFMISVSLLIYLNHSTLIMLFIKKSSGMNVHPEAIVELGGMVLLLTAGWQIMEALNSVLGKALQGAGETMYVMACSAIFQWGLFLPLAVLLALVLEGGGYGSTVAMAVQITCAGTVLMLHYRRRTWTKRRV